VNASRRLHPSLLVHSAQLAGRRRLVAQASSSSPPLVLNDPAALAALTVLPARFDRADAGEAWAAAGISERHHEQLWSAFLAAGLLVDDCQGGGSWWSELGWQEAGAYHLATRDYPFLQMDAADAFAVDARRMDSYRAGSPAPPVYLQRAATASIELDAVGEKRSPDELAAEMSAQDRLGLPGLGLLLDVCFGERGSVQTAGGVSCLLKSIPSGGARHPTEVYLASLDLRGVPGGVYHYNVQHHRLDRLRDGDDREALMHATYDLFVKQPRAPSALLIFTSVVERAMWRYRDPRSFRAILLDVGHAVAAYRHAARTLGFRTYACQKMRDGEIADLLDIDPVLQPPLYAASLVSPADG